MAIGIEKILTSSARDYVETIGTKLSDYNMVGVHVDNFAASLSSRKLIEYFAEQVPQGAIVVVSYCPAPGEPHRDVASGTALVPKRK
jgi:hypothetical protein